ncbi:hypothetical protein MKW98_027992 [Papaver atlanticum]|uniref:Cysteine proteinase inhibitor n=1 Tax=Papaver atlanticum TaxID=357466 RepID=A0AAD4T4M7_9MAGN|nr:hypothetical protein MKW98_027992 [Papaver atlanticum]
MANVLGGVRDCNESSENSLETESLARFAVDEHNKKENAVLEFGRVLKAKEQHGKTQRSWLNSHIPRNNLLGVDTLLPRLKIRNHMQVI